MAKPIATIGSDNHLDWMAWERREGLVGDAFYSFEQLVDCTIHRRTPLMLIGDTINTKRPDAQTAEFLRKQLDRLAEAECPVWYTQGQHEAATPPWFSAVHDWPVHAHKLEFKLGGVKCYGLDWLPNEELLAELDQVPKGTKILFLHQVVEEFMGGIRQCDVSLTQVPHATTIFIGDFHQHKQIEVLNRDGKRTKVYSPGSACMRKIDEPPQKSFYILHDDMTVKSEQYATRAVLQPPRITTAAALDKFVEEVGSQIEKAVYEASSEGAEAAGFPECLRKPLLWVHYNDDVENAWPRIQKAVGNAAYLFKRVHIVETEEKTVKRETRKKTVGRGPVAALPLLIPDEKSFVYSGSRRLLEAPEGEWALELQKLRAERGITETKK